jgi:hypothetical protein
MRLSTKYKAGLVLLVCAGLGLWFWRSLEAGRERAREQYREHCLDNVCEGDVVPKYDPIKEFAFKLNGQWFIGPREYGGYGGSLAFFWPSKTPRNRIHAERDAPEFVPSAAGRSSNFYDVAIEIFLRSNNIPLEPRGYKLIELAQTSNWIASREQVRPGLEAIRMKHVIGPRGYSIDHVTYYVATQLKGVDGLPPVATCDNSRADGSGGTGFMWQPGIWAGTRMNQKHCADWPEIYLEIIRVLQLLRRV